MKKLIKGLKVFGIVTLTLIVILLITVAIYNRTGNTHIRAQISGLGNRLVILTYQSEKTKSFKVALCLNDQIDVKASVNELCGARISTFKRNNGSRANQIRFFLEPNDELMITGTVNPHSIDYHIAKGNSLSIQYSQLQKDLLPYFEREFDLKQKYRQTHNPDYKSQLDSLIHYVLTGKKLDFVKRHPDYELSADLLSEQKEDTIVKYAGLLTEQVRRHPFGMMLFKHIQGIQHSKAGLMAPTFTQTTYAGNQFAIGDLKGKYVVLDFWGSWCSWCIKDFPRMKAYYAKYKEKVEFVGIACNDSELAWRKAVKNNQLEWVNILNDKNRNDLSSQYAITAFPTKVILDKEGRIYKKIVGESPVFYQTIDSLMNVK